MRKISDNKYLDAMFKLMLVSASIHMIILIVFAIYTHNQLALNYFNILDIEFVFPSVVEGMKMNILAFLTALWIYLLFFFDLV
jgi:hypothetical protein